MKRAIISVALVSMATAASASEMVMMGFGTQTCGKFANV
jgi:hypothetical protein